MMGVAGTAAGVGLAVIRERIDRITDSRAAKQAANDQESVDASRSGDSNDSE